jgi:hypothetical protein
VGLCHRKLLDDTDTIATAILPHFLLRASTTAVLSLSPVMAPHSDYDEEEEIDFSG